MEGLALRAPDWPPASLTACRRCNHQHMRLQRCGSLNAQQRCKLRHQHAARKARDCQIPGGLAAIPPALSCRHTSAISISFKPSTADVGLCTERQNKLTSPLSSLLEERPSVSGSILRSPAWAIEVKSTCIIREISQTPTSAMVLHDPTTWKHADCAT